MQHGLSNVNVLLLKSIIESRNISENSLKSVHKKTYTYGDWGAWPRGPPWIRHCLRRRLTWFFQELLKHWRCPDQLGITVLPSSVCLSFLEDAWNVFVHSAFSISELIMTSILVTCQAKYKPTDKWASIHTHFVVVVCNKHACIDWVWLT